MLISHQLHWKPVQSFISGGIFPSDGSKVMQQVSDGTRKLSYVVTTPKML